MSDRLTVSQVAALADVKPATWRAYVSRGQAPAASGRIDARTPTWDRGDVVKWMRRRSVRMATRESAPPPGEG